MSGSQLYFHLNELSVWCSALGHIYGLIFVFFVRSGSTSGSEVVLHPPTIGCPRYRCGVLPEIENSKDEVIDIHFFL